MANRSVVRLWRLVSEFDELTHAIQTWEIRLNIPGPYPRRYRYPIRTDFRGEYFRFETRDELVAHIQRLTNKQHEITLKMKDEVIDLALNRIQRIDPPQSSDPHSDPPSN